MKPLVLYYSKTGNTKKIAESMANELKAELRTVENAGDISRFDLICLGTPVYALAPAPEVKSFLEDVPGLEGKKVAAFCTLAGIGAKPTFNYIREAVEKKGARLVATFACKCSSGIVAGLGPKVWRKGHPDEEDLEKAAKFAKGLPGLK